MAAIDGIRRFKKVKVFQPWRVEQETVGMFKNLHGEEMPIHRCTLFLSGSAAGVLDWNWTSFYDRKFYAFLSGSDRYTVLRLEDEEGYVPPKEIRFGPQAEETAEEDAAAEEPVRGAGEAPEGRTDEGPPEGTDGQGTGE
jgi:hypothetical protein